MSKAREIGYTVVWSRDNSTYRLPPNFYEPLKTAWMAGKPFFEATTFWGGPIVIKLSIVESVQLSTPESIKLYEAEVEEEKYKE